MAIPSVKCIWLALLICASICLFDYNEASVLVEAQGNLVALEGPELKASRAGLGQFQECSSYCLSLVTRQHVKLVDPA